jgi:hypothetical protein
MSLPTQLKSARMTDATAANLIDNYVGELEQALCDILGPTINTNITESHFNLDNSGRVAKALVRQAAAPPVGWRFRDTSNNKEFRLALNNGNILIDQNTGSEGSPSWSNRLSIGLTTGLITMGTSTDPSGNNDLARKAYVDSLGGGGGGGDIPAGTKMLFFQASAPTGWTKYTSINDKMVRITNGAGGGTGGNWTLSGVWTGGHTLTIDEIPAHTHSYSRWDGTSFVVGSGTYTKGAAVYSADTSSVGGSNWHNHDVAADGTWRPAYADCIICTKN